MTNDAGIWAPGDRVWLLPDCDKREVIERSPAVVVRQLDSGRVRVTYVDQRCLLTKTVEPKRIEERSILCRDLRERA